MAINHRQQQERSQAQRVLSLGCFSLLLLQYTLSPSLLFLSSLWNNWSWFKCTVIYFILFYLL